MPVTFLTKLDMFTADNLEQLFLEHYYKNYMKTKETLKFFLIF